MKFYLIFLFSLPFIILKAQTSYLHCSELISIQQGDFEYVHKWAIGHGWRFKKMEKTNNFGYTAADYIFMAPIGYDGKRLCQGRLTLLRVLEEDNTPVDKWGILEFHGGNIVQWNTSDKNTASIINEIKNLGLKKILETKAPGDENGMEVVYQGKYTTCILYVYLDSTEIWVLNNSDYLQHFDPNKDK